MSAPIKILAICFWFMIGHYSALAFDTTDSLLNLFKNELLLKKRYDQQKESRISTLKNAIASSQKDNFDALYNLNSSLWYEYNAYQRDSALTYSHRLLQLAIQANDISKINDARIKMGQVLIPAGMFKEASDHLKMIDIKSENRQMKRQYYGLLSWLYESMANFNGDKIYTPSYLQKYELYADSALLNVGSASFELELAGRPADSTKANRLKNYRYYITYLLRYSEDPHKNARIAFELSNLYTDQKKLDLLLISAINDIRSSTKQTLASTRLGEELYKKGDIENAYIALQQAMDEADFYGSRSRKAQISSTLPYVTAQKMLRTERYTIAVILLAFTLALILVVIWYSRKRLKSFNEQIQTQNSDMQKTLSALEQSQEENTRMMKIVAHDLRSPMAATVSITSLLLRNDYLLPEDKEMLMLMKTSSLQSLEMISDLLNVNVATEGLKKEPVEMHTLLRYCVDLLKFKAAEKEQNILLAAEDMVANVNREKIWRVFSNLIVNSIKFSPKGSDIELSLLDQGDSIQIKVADHGIGIPEGVGDKIFDMFTGARRQGTSGEHSFGLGLAISREIVEAHGGKIWFQSVPAGGTTFYVVIPKN